MTEGDSSISAPITFELSPARSLQSRITIVTLILFVVSIWSLALFTSRMLRDDLQQLLGSQQLSTTAIVAQEINQEMMDRQHGLEEVAQHITERDFANPAALQRILTSNTLFLQMFNGGAFITQGDGLAVASVPESARRVGVNYIERDHIITALRQGKPAIGEPIIGKMLQAPVVSMAVPVRNSRNDVIGTVVGVTVLSKVNFLDLIFGHRYGKTGGYQLVDPVHRRFVAATDKRYLLAPLPDTGRVPFYDHLHNEYSGTSLTIDAQGVENLTSATYVSSTGWYVVALLPTEEAYAPIRAMESRTWLAAAVLILLAGGVTWWLLRRELAPLVSTASALASLRDADAFPQALQITRKDEIGQVIWGFNRLLDVLHERENALLESQERLSTLVSWTPVAIAVHARGKILFVNPAAVQLLGGTSAADLVGRAVLDFIHPDYRHDALARTRAATGPGMALPIAEAKFLTLQGNTIDVETQTIGIIYDGEPAGQVAIYDITDRKLAEKKLRQLSRITEQAQIAIVITNLRGAIEYVNPKFVEVTGFQVEEVIGRNPRILQSGQTPAGTYASLWQTLLKGSVWRGEFRNRKKNGDIMIEQAVIAPVLDPSGVPTHYVALKEDITVRKHNQQRLERLLQEQRTMLENDLIGILRVADETVLWANPAMEAMLGYGPGQMVGLPTRAHFLSDAAYNEVFATADEQLKSGQVFRRLVEYVRKGGEHLWVDVSGSLLHPRSRESLWACLDVTHRVQTEAALNASLQEKTALLNEVHHRVKNNLQVITSLLRLEDGRAMQEEAKVVLRDMQGRIRSMALVHETLYRSGTFSSVDLHHYLQQVASGAFRAQSSGTNAIRLALDLSPVKSSLDLATPCGLLVNELISNSLKHAFGGLEKGEVRVALRSSAQASPDAKMRWQLAVSDNGVGLPADFEVRRAKSLGLQLVSDLVRQLGGTLEIGHGPGASFTVTFPIDAPK